MRRLLPCLFLALAALPARADLANDYATLFQSLPLDLSRDPAAQFASAEARIQAMAGRWVALSILAGDGPGPLDPAIIANACTRTTMDFLPVGGLGVEVTTGNAKSAAKARLQFVGGYDFVGTIDGNTVLDRLIPDPADRRPDLSYRMLTQHSLLGRVILLPVGDNILLLIAERRPPEIWGRCGG